jgi:hypothetical protein
MKYGSSYTKSSDLSKYKQFVFSLFQISLECLENWAKWLPEEERQFVKAQREVSTYKNNP